MDDETKDLIAVNRAWIAQADAWLKDYRDAKTLGVGEGPSEKALEPKTAGWLGVKKTENRGTDG